MVNPQELDICRRRGHGVQLLRERWLQCRWCGMWLRTKQVIEEREDEPPEKELDPSVTLDRQMRQLRDGMKRPRDGGDPA